MFYKLRKALGLLSNKEKTKIAIKEMNEFQNKLGIPESAVPWEELRDDTLVVTKGKRVKTEHDT